MSRYDYKPDGKSEVARMMYQIERGCEAIERVMNDPGFKADHETVRLRYVTLGRQQEKLARVVGEQASVDAMCDIYNEVLNRPATTGAAIQDAPAQETSPQ
ncbi:MAG: hypothetical protein WCD86_18155 [Ktedonobacteraceae bacterium]